MDLSSTCHVDEQSDQPGDLSGLVGLCTVLCVPVVEVLHGVEL